MPNFLFGELQLAGYFIRCNLTWLTCMVNDGYKYMLADIDVFSKCWVMPLKSKSDQEVARGFAEIIKHGKLKIQTADAHEIRYKNIQDQSKQHDFLLKTKESYRSRAI